MVLIRLARRWWTASNPESLIESQNKLLQGLVNAPFVQTSAAGLNSVEFRKKESDGSAKDTIVLAHGFGSGLGFFYPNVDSLLSRPSIRRVLLVDWLGMGGSERPQCYQRPMRGWSAYTTSWCDSRYSPSEAVKFFTDPFHEWMESQVTNQAKNGSDEKVTLVGHSLGGYLAGRYVLDYPTKVNKLVLASPVGIPVKPDTALKGSSLPTSIRVVDALWSSNLTPQQLIRLAGSTRGRRNIHRVLQGRIPQLANRPKDLRLLAEYLYNITVADPSGEFAMNSLLEPVMAPDMMGVFAREPLHDRFLELDRIKTSSLDEIRVIYGDNDWMRTNEPEARKVMDRMQNTFTGIKCDVSVVPNAGHHLYYDNSEDFVRQILS